MSPIAANLQAIRRRISEALQGDSRAVTLVAVSKSQPPEALREAFAAGVGDFGESYVQEARAKIARLTDLPARWHFIGHVQTNKAHDIASSFDFVHGVDRLRVAEALSRARAPTRGPLDICIQVNISGESSKGGASPAEAPALARAVAGLPRLRLRGLMGMASFTEEVASQREQFRGLAELRREIERSGLALDTLSMGMSGDFEAALAEGATMVRIGTAIFGQRTQPGSDPNVVTHRADAGQRAHELGSDPK